MPVTRPIPIALAALIATVGCSARDVGEPAATPEPASLSVTVPSPSAAIPSCTSPGVQLLRSGTDLGCGVICITGGSTCTIVCTVAAGLQSATPYDLAAVLVQGSTPVARASLGAAVILSPGTNQREVALAALEMVDANADGTPDVAVLCP